jgi:hypothetical protein
MPHESSGHQRCRPPATLCSCFRSGSTVIVSHEYGRWAPHLRHTLYVSPPLVNARLSSRWWHPKNQFQILRPIGTFLPQPFKVRSPCRVQAHPCRRTSAGMDECTRGWVVRQSVGKNEENLADSGPAPGTRGSLLAGFTIASQRLHHRAMRREHGKGAVAFGARPELAIDIEDVFPRLAVYGARFDLGQICAERRQF